jgi:hypothetical protein
VKQLARKSAQTARAREGALHLGERFAFRKPRTAQLAGLLGSLELDGRTVLVLTAGANESVYLSGRNLPTVEVMPYFEASAYDVLWSDAVVVEEGALTGVMPEPLPEETEEEAEASARPRKRPAAAKSEKATKSAAKTAKKAKAKSAKAAKKSATKSAKKAKPAKKSAAKRAKKAAPKKKKGSK